MITRWTTFDVKPSELGGFVAYGDYLYTQKQIARLKKKLAKRDKRILGLMNYIKELEHSLATKDIEAKKLPIDIAKAVQDALCNVRMVPVIGLWDKKIVSIKIEDEVTT